MSEASGAEALTGQDAEASPGEGEATGNAELPWYGSEESKAYLDKKGWSEPGQVLDGYRNLEKILGDKANALIMPKEGDTDAWGNFYNTLGRPETPDGYQFEGEGGRVTDWFRESAHKHGLTQTQAQALFGEWNQLNETINQEFTEESEAKAQQDLDTLKREWGQEYDANILAGKKAAQRFGFSQEELTAIEGQIGTKELLSRWAKIGRAMGEAEFEGGKGDGGFGLTPAAAQSQIMELQGNQEFLDAYLSGDHPGHKNAMEKMTRLQKAAAGGM